MVPRAREPFIFQLPLRGTSPIPMPFSFFFVLLILVGYMGIFLAALVIEEIFYQFSVRIVPHIDVFCCVCWGRQVAGPSTPLS